MAATVKIDGLTEFQSGLNDLRRDLPKALHMAFNDAADIVGPDARARVPSRTGRAKGTVKARSTETSATVTGGGSGAPYYPWLDFGGRVGRRRSVKRPFLVEGRYIYNVYFRAEGSGRFQDSLTNGLMTVARSARIEVT